MIPVFLKLHFLFGTINVISSYAPQFGLSAEEDAFYHKIINLVAAVPDEDMLFIGRYFNGNVGKNSAGFEAEHRGNGYWRDKSSTAVMTGNDNF